MIDPNSPNIIQPKEKRIITSNNTRIVHIGEPEQEKDATTKKYVDNLLDKKQDKLTAGTNITIDEDNVISSCASETDLSDYYKKEEVNKKLEDTEKKFPVAFQLNATGQEIPNLETTNKTVTSGINELKEKIDEKIINNGIWKEVGHSLNNRTWGYFILKPNTNYRIFFTWNNNANNTIPIKRKIEFSTNKEILDGDYLLNSITIGEIDINLDLEIRQLIFNKIIFKNGNKNNCYIFTLEEFQENKENNYKIISNTLDITSPNKINMEKPIKINSKSLETNEIEENNWDIELKNNPRPYIPYWEEVGEVITDKNNNNQNFIKYIFKDKTHYRIYISYGDYTTKENNKNYSWQIINFYYQLDTSVVKSSLWIANNNNNQQTEINIYNNRIMWGMGRDYIFKKLEELQEQYYDF